MIFNGLLQPQFIFTQNIFQSICNTLEPLTKLIAITLKPLTDCVRAFRIVEVKNLYKDPASGRFQTFQGQNNAWRIILPIKIYLRIKFDCVVKKAVGGMGWSHLQIEMFRALEQQIFLFKYLRIWHARRRNEQSSVEFLLQDVQIRLKLERNDMSVICLRLGIQKLSSRNGNRCALSSSKLKACFPGVWFWISVCSNDFIEYWNVCGFPLIIWLNNWFMAFLGWVTGIEA